MPQKDMRIIPAPANEEGVLAPERGSPAIEGDGDTTYRCGGCKTKLLVDVSHYDVMHAHTFSAVKCPRCGKYNDLPPEDKHHHH
jgi:phage FluMu protein Com